MNLQTVCCIGELIWDVLPSGSNLGGAPANVAYHLARLGLPVRMISRLGRDELGNAARDALQSRGVPICDLQWDDKLPTGAAHVVLDASGQAAYRFVTPAAWDAITLPAFTPEVVVFGSLAQRDARSASALLEFARRAAVRVYDVNLRPPFTAMEIVAQSLPLATLVKVNDEEAERIGTALQLPRHGRKFAEALAARFGVRLVCITRGAGGAAMWTGGAWFETDGVPIEPVDTVGAGDAFLAALIRGWLAGDEPPRIIERANRLGAYIATQCGAMPDYDAGAIAPSIG
jgi:fructokinase